MRILRNLSILTALLFAMDSGLASDVVLVARTDGPPAIDDAALMTDMIGAQEALLIAEQNEQLGNTGGSYADTEVDYVIRELMVASDVSFLGFDCAILPASSSAEEMLILSSTEQATNSIAVTPFAVPEVSATANLDLGSANLNSGMTWSIANGARTDHNS